jgi:hypothetical protein
VHLAKVVFVATCLDPGLHARVRSNAGPGLCGACGRSCSALGPRLVGGRPTGVSARWTSEMVKSVPGAGGSVRGERHVVEVLCWIGVVKWRIG